MSNLLLIAEYRIFGIEAKWHIVFNMVVLMGIVALLSRLIYNWTGCIASATLVPILFLSDFRLRSHIVSMDNATPLACLFGMAALVLLLEGRRTLLAALLLFLAVGSKEFGLAFCGAAVVLSMLSQGKHQGKYHAALAGCGVALLYMLCRITLGDMTVGPYTQDMGYFCSQRLIDWSSLTFSEAALQGAYNIGATFIGTIFPPLFSQQGRLWWLDSRSWFECLILAILAILAVRADWRRSGLGVSLWAGCSLLCFLSYRSYNQVIGLLGLLAIAGIGLAPLLRNRKTSVVITIILFVIIGFKTMAMTRGVCDLTANLRQRAVIEIPVYYDPTVLAEIEERYR